ncbi:major facilitator superfamily domain-containing protein [Xylaria flabelliformis]|nr:major facilitator superfamily domain-containing protein [Xylaria flabelliformis]
MNLVGVTDDWPLTLTTVQGLSQNQNQHRNGTPKTRYEKDDDEKSTEIRPQSSSSTGTSSQLSTSPNQDSQIEYLYLNFDTVLPAPNLPTTIRTAAEWEAVPEPPDLTRYIDPLRWPRARKNVMVTISCMATLFTAYTAGAYSPPVDLIAAELHTSHEIALLGVTTFCLGFAFAPMILAPFSEINGRYPVFAVAGVFFTVFQAVCGIVTTLPGMLLARFFKGVGGSVFSTMVGGVISDLYDKEARNTPMAMFSGAVLVGTGLGPLISSVIVEASEAQGPNSQTWKWVFWHQVIVDFILMIAVVTFFKESRGSVVLSRKAQALNKWYEELEEKGFVGVWVQENSSSVFHLTQASVNYFEKQPSPFQSPLSIRGSRLRRIRWTTKADEERGSIVTMISSSLTRPFHFLFTEPIVFFFSLWVSFAWAILYLTFGSIPLVFRRQYGFTIEQSGYVFASMIVGGIIATIFGVLQDHVLKHPNWQSRPSDTMSINSTETIEPTPHDLWEFLRMRFPAESLESRLYFTCFAAVLLPIGLYLFGFSAQPSIPWIVPTIAIGLATMGIYYIYLATFNYLADIYQVYASSALAAQSFCRNILGGVFPLVVSMLFTNLGENAAGGLLGSIATVLTVVPWVLVLFGERIRRRSKYAVAIQKFA